MSERWLLLETSSRSGRVGLAVGDAVVRQVQLDPARRHNRDLAPAVAELLRAEGIVAKDLTGVMVSIGPGSYTGLRVGAMSAKALAYATGCGLVPVPTFAVIAEQTPAEAATVEVIADALQGQAYVQRFVRGSAGWTAAEALHIEPARPRLERLTGGVWVSGPGVALYDALIPAGVNRVEVDARHPGLDALFRVGRRLSVLTRDEVLRLEPLYLRGSSAEEKAAK